jgi:hypothetical protein
VASASAKFKTAAGIKPRTALACNLLLCVKSRRSAQCFSERIMPTHRGRRRTVKNAKQPHASASPRAIRLAPGVRVDGSGERNALFVLVCDGHDVQLNRAALTVLKLCDGTRDRRGIVSELTHGSQRQALAGEITEFLDAAFARGWIVDG